MVRLARPAIWACTRTGSALYDGVRSNEFICTVQMIGLRERCSRTKQTQAISWHQSVEAGTRCGLRVTAMASRSRPILGKFATLRVTRAAASSMRARLPLIKMYEGWRASTLLMLFVPTPARTAQSLMSRRVDSICAREGMAGTACTAAGAAGCSCRPTVTGRDREPAGREVTEVVAPRSSDVAKAHTSVHATALACMCARMCMASQPVKH